MLAPATHTPASRAGRRVNVGIYQVSKQSGMSQYSDSDDHRSLEN